MLPAAIILAGGFGTRLKSVVGNVPKPMAPVRNKPFLDYQLDWLRSNGCTNVVLSVGYLADKISDHYGEDYHDIRLRYSVETEPLGTGGAIKRALSKIDDSEVIVLNGDSLFRIDLSLLVALHREKKAQFSIALRQVSDASRYGKIMVDQDCRITAFTEKSPEKSPGLINAGIYVLKKQTFLEVAPAKDIFSIEKDFFSLGMENIPVFGFGFDAYFIDIGIPEDYERAQHEFERFEDK